MPVLTTLGAATAKAWGFLQQVAAAADPYFNYVTMLLTGNGTNGAQNNTFLDSSSNAFSITRNGNTTQGSFSPYGSLWSNYLNGSSNLTTSSAIGATSVTTTVEYWAYSTVNGNSATAILGQNGTDFFIGVENDKPSLWANTTLTVVSGFTGTLDGGADNRAVKGSTSVSLNTWHHYAWVFSVGGSTTTCTLYVDGSSYGSFTFSNVSRTIGAIGAFAPGSGYPRYFNGYVSNVRVTNSAVYTGAFTPSTTPLTAISGTQLLTCQSNRFIDNSSNAYTISVNNGTPSVQRFSPFNPTASYSTATIGGSGYFDGSGDYLNGPNASGGDFGTGDFTISFWFYKTASGNQGGVAYADGTGWNGWQININTSSISWQFLNGSGGTATITAGSYSLNCWNHITVTRASGTITLYVNGTSVGTASDSGSYGSSTSKVRVGIDRDVAYVTGYISDVKLIKGTAVAPSGNPTSPATATSGTSLLLNMTNAGIPDSAMMNDLETVGNAQVSTSVSKFGTGSIAFDGSGDYLVSNPSSVNDLSSGNWTIEFWCYPTSASSSKTLINAATSSSNPNGTHIWMNTSRQLVVDNTTTGQSAFSGGTLTLNTWNHVAIVRSSGTTTGYINGTSVGSNTYTPNANQVISVGYLIANAGYDFAGYIDDLRITKGYARYTSNFTAPTAAFPTY